MKHVEIARPKRLWTYGFTRPLFISKVYVFIARCTRMWERAVTC